MKGSAKLIGAILLLVLLLPVVFMFGNPVSYALIWLRGNAYLDETYPELDVRIDGITYDFKHGSWSAEAVSPTSRDTRFRVYIDGFGNVEGDAYSTVLNGGTTASRLGQEYRALAEQVFASGDFPYDHSICFGELTMGGGIAYYTVTGKDGTTAYWSMEKDYGLDSSALTLDAEYDVRALGAEHGRLTVTVHDEEVTVERAAAILLELRAYFDGAGLPFHGIHFHLCEPLSETGQNAGEVQIDLYDFLYDDIYEDGMTGRIRAAWEETQAHYARINSDMYH